MPRTFDIGLCREILGEQICNIILFLHAYTGCDSTSKISKITKSAVFKKLVNNENYFLKFCTYSQSFLIPDQTSDIIESHGIDTMKLLFQAVLRSKLSTEKVIKSKSFVIPENLPPTDAGTKFHSYWVYYQIMVWADTPLHNPEKWGWYKKHGMLYPIHTDLPPAPQYLLKIIHCLCKTGCVTFHCQCKKNGLSCSSACRVCQTTNCSNAITLVEHDDTAHSVLTLIK